VAKPRRYLRFPAAYRVEHWWLAASFTTLAVTGLVQKYAGAGIATAVVGLLGGVETVRVIHRVAAVALMLEVVYHLGAVAYRLFVRHARPAMLPGLDDVRAALQAFRHNLGLAKRRPQQGRYTFEEKFEYWSVVWGTLVMAVTGFMMWNPIAATRVLPGQVVPAAKAAHGGEALLAVLAILVWHMYHVVLRHLNRSMFDGHLTEDEMVEEHPLELADLKAGLATRPVDPARQKRRARVFFPVYGVIAAALLFGIYRFVTFEHTAIDTLPPSERVVVFAPLTPTPFPTALPTRAQSAASPTTWAGGIDDWLSETCGMCHGGDSAIAGLDLTAYAAALEGGASGPAIVPGDPENSLLLIRQAAGNHPGQLTGEQLEAIRAWIEAGAPER
jgi:cytochrome b subunit of formate dehydrogenase